MPNVIECSSCHRRLSVPDDLVGCPVQCPTCGMTFLAPLAGTGVTESWRPGPGASERASEPAAPGELEVSPEEQNVLTAPVRNLPPPPLPLRPVPLDGSPPLPAAGSPADRRLCPECGALLPPRTARCPWCGPDDEDDRPWERPEAAWIRRDCEPHRGALILVLGILSLVAFGFGILSPFGVGLGVAAWIMGERDLGKMRQKIMDPQGKGLTQAGRVCGIIGTLLSSLCVLGYGGMILLPVLLR